MRTGRHVLNAVALGALTLLFAVLGMAVLPFTRGRGVGPVARWWARAVVRATGVEVVVEGLERALDAPSYLVMANHTSHYDVLCLFAAVPLEVRPVAKKELAWIPVFGWALALGAAILIDRGSTDRAIVSIERAGRTIRRGGSVLMFPEGTRTAPGVLGPLKKGPFHLALAARVPVLPVGIEGSGAVLRPGDWRITPGRVVVRVGAPIEVAAPPAGRELEAREALAAQVASALRALSS